MSNRINKNSRKSAKVSRDDQGEPMRDDYNDDQSQEQPQANLCTACGQLDIWCQCKHLYEASLTETDMERGGYCAPTPIATAATATATITAVTAATPKFNQYDGWAPTAASVAEAPKDPICTFCGDVYRWCPCDPIHIGYMDAQYERECALRCKFCNASYKPSECPKWSSYPNESCGCGGACLTPCNCCALCNETQDHSDKMTTILQQFANQDRIRVKRYREGQRISFLSLDGTTDDVEGWLSSQDIAQGWIEKYSLWTQDEGNGYISIKLMISSDIVPSLPEFNGCSNASMCNLDDFHSFTITIKREFVVDLP
jgi:hypothetical protein